MFVVVEVVVAAAASLLCFVCRCQRASGYWRDLSRDDEYLCTECTNWLEKHTLTPPHHPVYTFIKNSILPCYFFSCFSSLSSLCISASRKPTIEEVNQASAVNTRWVRRPILHTKESSNKLLTWRGRICNCTNKTSETIAIFAILQSAKIIFRSRYWFYYIVYMFSFSLCVHYHLTCNIRCRSLSH